jgi:NADH:ubiquinone oxidoreductase subunit
MGTAAGAGRLHALDDASMSLFSPIFTWWNGSTWGTRRTVSGASEVGRDASGNAYYTRGTRRFVVYHGYADASDIPPDWHLWMHGADMPPPSLQPLTVPRWVKPPLPNLTGTPKAHMPSGALARSGVRARATGDYEAWEPDA